MHYDFKKQIRSFGYAWKGIRCVVGKEQNLNFHFIATVCVVVAGHFFHITRMPALYRDGDRSRNVQ